MKRFEGSGDHSDDDSDDMATQVLLCVSLFEVKRLFELESVGCCRCNG